MLKSLLMITAVPKGARLQFQVHGVAEAKGLAELLGIAIFIIGGALAYAGLRIWNGSSGADATKKLALAQKNPILGAVKLK